MSGYNFDCNAHCTFSWVFLLQTFYSLLDATPGWRNNFGEPNTSQ